MRWLLVAFVASGLAAACQGSGRDAGPADDPVEAVERLFQLVEEKRLGELALVVCEEQRVALAAAYDPASAIAASVGGVDASALLAAMDVTVADLEVREVRRNGARAVVTATGTITVEADEAQVRSILAPLLDQQGLPPGMLDSVLESIGGQTVPIDLRREVVREDGSWFVCGELGG